MSRAISKSVPAGRSRSTTHAFRYATRSRRRTGTTAACFTSGSAPRFSSTSSSSMRNPFTFTSESKRPSQYSMPLSSRCPASPVR